MEETNFREQLLTVLTAIGVALTGIFTYVRKRNRRFENTSTPANGNVVLDQMRMLGDGNKALLESYKERVVYLEEQNKECAEEKETLAKQVMVQAREMARLRASVTILEAQVAVLSKQVAILEGRNQ